MKKTMGFNQAGWRMLAYDTLIGEGEKMIGKASKIFEQSSCAANNFI